MVTVQNAQTKPMFIRRTRRDLVLLVRILTILTVGVPAWAEQADAPSQAAEEVDPWGPLRLLPGSWEGAIDGRLGTGRGLRRYDFILGDQFLQVRHSSVRQPQEKSPKGDQHEELAIFSYDSERQMIVLRQFMIEGVVNRYTCQVEAKNLVCTTEAVESGPGIRARLTMKITDRYRFEEEFEIGWPGKDLKLYFTNVWTRSPTLGAD